MLLKLWQNNPPASKSYNQNNDRIFAPRVNPTETMTEYSPASISVIQNYDRILPRDYILYPKQSSKCMVMMSVNFMAT